jgi:four helix bundle protein
MRIARFEDLECWREARELTRQVYEAVGKNNGWRQDFRLREQIQSASGSVMANIAEGFARRSNREFIQFLFVSMASAAEVQSHLYIAADQGYLPKASFDSIYGQAEKTSRIISGLITYLRSHQTKRTK